MNVLITRFHAGIQRTFPYFLGGMIFFYKQFAIIPVQLSSGEIFQNIDYLGFWKCNVNMIRRKHTKLKFGVKE